MRLLLVTNDYPPRPGGIQQYLGNLVDVLPADTRVLAPRDGAAANVRGEGVVVRDRSRFMLPTRRVRDAIVDQVEDFKPDAVLFGAPHPLTALIPRLDIDVPIGVIAHGAEVTIPSSIPPARQALRRLLRAADVLFAVSRYTKREVASLTGREVRYLGGGVDVEKFRPGPRIEKGRGLVIGCVSRFVPRKGQLRLLVAVAEVRKRGIDASVLLVGRGRLEAKLRRKASELGVPTRFEVDVPWDDLPGLYREMDVFCMPCSSRWGGLEIEGLGLVFLEAAACGLPVLAGDSGGAPETVVPGSTGYIVHSVRDVVDGLERLLDGRRREAMGNAGRARVESEYRWADVAERLVAGLQI